MKFKVLETATRTSKNGKYISIEKDLYITCDCDSLNHIARVKFCRELETVKGKRDKDGNKIAAMIRADDVYLEFNATDCIDPVWDSYDRFEKPWDYIKWPFIRYYRRFKSAWDLIRGKPVHFCSDIIMTGESALELAEKIMRTVYEFNSKGNPDEYKT